MRDEDGVRERFGVGPASIPDYLALVGDSADGFPGLPGWGAKSAAALLARWGTIDAIPDDPAEWDVTVRGAARAGRRRCAKGREAAALFRVLATLRDDAQGVLEDGVAGLEWRGPPRAVRRGLPRPRRARPRARVEAPSEARLKRQGLSSPLVITGCFD